MNKLCAFTALFFISTSCLAELPSETNLFSNPQNTRKLSVKETTKTLSYEASTLYINDSDLALAKVEFLKESESYKLFPTAEDASFDENQLMPLGLLSIAETSEQILIALPLSSEVLDREIPYTSYSFTDSGWQVDKPYLEYINEDDDDLEYFDDLTEFYQRITSIFAQDRYYGNKVLEALESSLLELGGHPILGNWSMYLWNTGDDLKMNYSDAMHKKSGEAYEHYSSRQLAFYDEKSKVHFSYLGTLPLKPYFNLGGDAVLFYNAEHKKVLLTIDY